MQPIRGDLSCHLHRVFHASLTQKVVFHLPWWLRGRQCRWFLGRRHSVVGASHINGLSVLVDVFRGTELWLR